MNKNELRHPSLIARRCRSALNPQQITTINTSKTFRIFKGTKLIRVSYELSIVFRDAQSEARVRVFPSWVIKIFRL